MCPHFVLNFTGSNPYHFSLLYLLDDFLLDTTPVMAGGRSADEEGSCSAPGGEAGCGEPVHGLLASSEFEDTVKER